MNAKNVREASKLYLSGIEIHERHEGLGRDDTSKLYLSGIEIPRGGLDKRHDRALQIVP